MEEKIVNLEKEARGRIEGVKTAKELEELRIYYLGRKSFINQLFSSLPDLEKEKKAYLGKLLNSVKKKITEWIEKKRREFEEREEKVDFTFPAPELNLGKRHIIGQVMEEICKIFKRLGFQIVEGGEIEDEWHNFSALNIPLEHPSRDVFDTFYLDIPSSEEGRYLLRSHTSPSQIRVMEKRTPPLAVISPGRVYRPDNPDASHSFMFHQIEGFCVDKEINFSHLKGVLYHFAWEFFSSQIKLRFRPHYFPFTEPSAEVDISCIICGGKGSKDGEKCSVCKGKGWLEILGCGMIHPKVLKNCGINPKKFRGFAFGMGVERIAMLKYRIADIRLFFENDLRFLNQFG
ncbi:MAG: phenylalanine--tRNA ligase subunit alpha [Candidatus Omnitrophica bacterium 4484_70.1]|nr:MAG: phenylalanine--tRNA ligase subunit alpha [Candidatus Omnitrophica bacterium 4484_70.1]